MQGLPATTGPKREIASPFPPVGLPGVNQHRFAALQMPIRIRLPEADPATKPVQAQPVAFEPDELR
jgi:hypothetical protein